MHLPRSLLFVPFVLALFGGCRHSPTPELVVDGFTLNPDPWLEDRQKIAQRASFDLNCPADKIGLTVLAVGGNGMWFDDWATQVGASGCDQRVVYIRTPQGWVANIARTDAAQPPPAAPPPPPVVP
ncbi:hypothetical protein OV079_22910 [Nannocystis pusilla]|uniref:Lipoprotein n=1 Tax=Nannocystis pusilla TaxID=889268 RepID=A0A9X3IZ87_9BACT|nr:hypothetical protein [Nannocystis pusilla]MCY1008354.1 hypothetical protein [Nannocystis pusilla]